MYLHTCGHWDHDRDDRACLSLSNIYTVLVAMLPRTLQSFFAVEANQFRGEIESAYFPENCANVVQPGSARNLAQNFQMTGPRFKFPLCPILCTPFFHY